MFAATLAAIAYDRRTAEDPDRIVGLILRCDFGYGVNRIDLNGPDCEDKSKVQNIRLIVTVRTGKGTTYSVETLPDRNLHPGDYWPPERE